MRALGWAAAFIARPWGFFYSWLLAGVIFFIGLGQILESTSNSSQPLAWDGKAAPSQQWVYLEGRFDGKLGDLYWLEAADQIRVLVEAKVEPPQGVLRVEGMARFLPSDALKQAPAKPFQRDFYLAAGERPSSLWGGLLLMLLGGLGAALVARLQWLGGLVFEPRESLSDAPSLKEGWLSCAGKFWHKKANWAESESPLELASLSALEAGVLHYRGKQLPAIRGRQGRKTWVVVTCEEKP